MKSPLWIEKSISACNDKKEFFVFWVQITARDKNFKTWSQGNSKNITCLAVGKSFPTSYCNTLLSLNLEVLSSMISEDNISKLSY